LNIRVFTAKETYIKIWLVWTSFRIWFMGCTRFEKEWKKWKGERWRV